MSGCSSEKKIRKFTRSIKDPGNVFSQSGSIGKHFLKNVDEFLFFKLRRFLYLCFCLCCPHWFRVGLGSVGKITTFHLKSTES